MNRLYLNTINVAPPPQHTQVQIRCESCSKKDVCQFQKDYRKVVTLIQQVLGDPQEDREVKLCDEGFTGYDFKDNSIFPQEVDIIPKKEDQEIKGELMSAKFSSEDRIKLLYKIEDFYVMFVFNWSTEFDRFEAEIGKELYYGVQYELSSDAIAALQEILATWRTELKENKRTDIDIINTTLFSAQLNCSAYEPNNLHRIKSDFKNHNDELCHIATYHCENTQVKPYNVPAPNMIPVYPVPIPQGPCEKPKRPPRRRDEQ